MGDKTRGLYGKFTVTRNDGSSEPGEKHHGCDYFVLDLTHDPHALPALAAYIRSCEKEYGLLAFDLRHKLIVSQPKVARGQWFADAVQSPVVPLI